MPQSSSTSAVAGMAGILGSAWAAGGIASLSFVASPGLLLASGPTQIVLKQWEMIYNRGKAVMPGIAIASLLGYIYRAYDRKSHGFAWERYVIAGALSVAIVPYTLIFMGSTNRALLQAAGGAATLSDGAIRSLLLKWQNLNAVRALLPLTGAILGLWTLVAP